MTLLKISTPTVVPDCFCMGSISSEDMAVIDGKPIIPLAGWLSLPVKLFYPGLTRSKATYSILGIPYVIVSYNGKSTPKIKDTKPILNQIYPEWDAEVGQPLTIPLSVADQEDDDFAIKGGVKGATFSDAYDLNQLPTVDFTWTPTEAQANKVYKVKFKAKETSAKKLSSKTVVAKIRVWPAGGQTDASSVRKFNVSKVKWQGDELTMKGKVLLNKIMTAEERTEFLQKQLDLVITSGNTGTGLPVGDSPLALQLLNNGNWTVSLPLPEAEVPCEISLEYQDNRVARKVKSAPKNCLQ